MDNLKHLTRTQIREREARRREMQLWFQSDIEWEVREGTRTGDSDFASAVRELEIEHGYVHSVRYSS